MANEEILTILEQRLALLDARQRLEIGKDHQSELSDHIERFPWSPMLMRVILRTMGLYQRGISNAAKVTLRHSYIVSSHLPKAFDWFDIVQLSDLHVEMNAAAMERVVDLLGEAHFDICVLTGDYRGGTNGRYD